MISTHLRHNTNKSCQDSDFFHLIILRKCFINISDCIITALPEAMLVLSNKFGFNWLSC